MLDREYLRNISLGDKAQENLRRNTELRTKKKVKENKLLVLRDREDSIRIFDQYKSSQGCEIK